MTGRSGTCTYCGREGRVEADHITGRDGDGVYFDPDLWLCSCRTCNPTMWQAWYAGGLSRVTAHPVATRLLRCAFALDHAAGSGRELVLPAVQARALAQLLRDAAFAIAGLTAALILLVVASVWRS
jgi:hypothetical protein